MLSVRNRYRFKHSNQLLQIIITAASVSSRTLSGFWTLLNSCRLCMFMVWISFLVLPTMATVLYTFLSCVDWNSGKILSIVVKQNPHTVKYALFSLFNDKYLWFLLVWVARFSSSACCVSLTVVRSWSCLDLSAAAFCLYSFFIKARFKCVLFL